MRGLTIVLGLAQAGLGAFGFFCIACYLADSASNYSRYQALFLPLWAFILAVPLLIVSVFLYRRCRTRLTRLDRWVFNIGCVLPIVSFGLAIALPQIRS